jgi:hypothetical protein
VDEDSAAAYVGRSRTAFRAQVASGLLPAHSDSNGNRKLWDVRRLDRYVDARSGLAENDNTWDDL